MELWFPAAWSPPASVTGPSLPARDRRRSRRKLQQGFALEAAGNLPRMCNLDLSFPLPPDSFNWSRPWSEVTAPAAAPVTAASCCGSPRRCRNRNRSQGTVRYLKLLKRKGKTGLFDSYLPRHYNLLLKPLISFFAEKCLALERKQEVYPLWCHLRTRSILRILCSFIYL